MGDRLLPEEARLIGVGKRDLIAHQVDFDPTGGSPSLPGAEDFHIKAARFGYAFTR